MLPAIRETVPHDQLLHFSGCALMPNQTDPWPIEELVRAQCMACEGRSFDDIARALGRSADEVRRRLEPDPGPRRQELANLGYPHLKTLR
jgi:hypothetical protein